MKNKTLILTAISVLFASAAWAKDDVEYSSEAYCLLKKENVDDRYLAAYAKKLGMTPTNSHCKAFNDYADQVRPAEWDYPQGKVYPGSVIRLSPSQIAKIKEAKKNG